jgi:hypothetical protein
MAFTEAQLLTDLQSSGTDMVVEIIGFIPVGTLLTDVYVQNHKGTKTQTGPWVQIAQTNTAAQAHVLIAAAMN